MRYNFVADSCHTKKLCSRLSSSEVENVNTIAFGDNTTMSTFNGRTSVIIFSCLTSLLQCCLFTIPKVLSFFKFLRVCTVQIEDKIWYRLMYTLPLRLPLLVVRTTSNDVAGVWDRVVQHYLAPRSESANRTLANSLPGTFTPWPFRSLANLFHGPFPPRLFRSREQKFG